MACTSECADLACPLRWVHGDYEGTRTYEVDDSIYPDDGRIAIRVRDGEATAWVGTTGDAMTAASPLLGERLNRQLIGRLSSAILRT